MNRHDIDTTGRWLCLWPNGTRSIVFDAYTVEDAIAVLDEIGSAAPYMLHALTAQPSFIDFAPELDVDMEEEYMGWVPQEVACDLHCELEEPREAREEKLIETDSDIQEQINNLEDMSAALLE